MRDKADKSLHVPDEKDAYRGDAIRNMAGGNTSETLQG